LSPQIAGIARIEYTSHGARSSGLCAACLKKVEILAKKLRIAAFQPDIAPNLGTMIRLAACFDAGIDVIEPCGFPFSVKALRRSAMDYADIADISRHASWQAFQASLTGRLILLSTKAARPLWDFSFENGDTIMMGRESAGVPADVANACDARLLIPMPGGGRSLNVAVSAGIALGEATRQLR
jgi:tRNA (cytidine/uridine-2'-O-)-methyltransferase